MEDCTMKKNVLFILCSIVLMIFVLNLTVTAQPPAEGLKLWLKADEGALKPNPEPNTTDYVPAEVGDTVTIWQDMSGNGHDASISIGAPTLISTGTQNAIRFDGNDGYLLTDHEGLRLSPISIYAVIDIDDNSPVSQCFVSNFTPVTGFAVGISDSVPNRLKWFTAGGNGDTCGGSGDSMEVNLPTGTPNQYIIVNATLDNANYKVIYFDGIHKAKNQSPGIGYGDSCWPSAYGPPEARVGELFMDLIARHYQLTYGNVSEILIYDSVNAEQYYAVHDYLSAKYGIATADDYQGADSSVTFLQELRLQSATSTGDPIPDGQTWNTMQLFDQTYWDMALLDDTIANLTGSSDPNMAGHLLNSPTNGGINVEMQKGRSYTFTFTGNGTPEGYDLTDTYYSLRFYLDQKTISSAPVWAEKDTSGPADGNPSMAGGPVVWKDPYKKIQVRCDHFVIYPKSAPDVSLDVQTEPWLPNENPMQIYPYEPDGIEDIAGEFTLTVEEATSFDCADMVKFYPMDFNEDCYVNLQDFAQFAQDWLKCNAPFDEECLPLDELDPNLLIWSGMELNSADASGAFVDPEYWNTIPGDDPWDIALFDTTITALMSDPNLIASKLVNQEDRSISLELVKGNTYSYSFAGSHLVGSDLGSLCDPNSTHTRISLLFDNQASGIAGFAENDSTGPADGHAAVAAAADGTLIWKSIPKRIQVRLTDFVIYPKSVVDISLDIMGTGSANPSGAFVPDGEEDVVGEFTFVVEEGEFTCAEIGKYYPYDFDEDCYVNLNDFALFAQQWLKCNDPENEICIWPLE